MGLATGLPEALTGRVAFLLRLALHRAEAMGEQALSGVSVTGREYGVLALLEGGTSSSQARIGETLGIDRTSIMAVVTGLDRRGLVSRVRDPANRRAYLVRLTAPGERVRARAATVLAACDEEFLAALPPPDRLLIRRLLHQLG